MATKLTVEQFIEKARAVHGPLYDYSLVVYLGRKKKVAIACQSHGHFEQTPNDHLSGNGCTKCGRLRTSAAQTLGQQGFLKNAFATHGVRYDYSLVVYRGAHRKVKIICPAHGQFEQSPTAHVSQASGCPGCKADKLRLSWLEQSAGRSAWLYLIRFFDDVEQFYKVGITFDSVSHRYSGKRKTSGYECEILVKHQSPSALSVYEWEQSILETFSHLAYIPKRRFKGFGECFSSADEILAIFPL